MKRMTTRAHGSREKIKYPLWIVNICKCRGKDQEFQILIHGPQRKHVQGIQQTCDVWIFTFANWFEGSIFEAKSIIFHHFPSFSIIFHGFLMISGRRNCTTASILDMPVINAPVSMRASASCDERSSHRLHWAEERQKNIWKSIKHMGMGQNPGT